jgi:hypothetical protein
MALREGSAGRRCALGAYRTDGHSCWAAPARSTARLDGALPYILGWGARSPKAAVIGWLVLQRPSGMRLAITELGGPRRSTNVLGGTRRRPRRCLSGPFAFVASGMGGGGPCMGGHPPGRPVDLGFPGSSTPAPCTLSACSYGRPLDHSQTAHTDRDRSFQVPLPCLAVRAGGGAGSRGRMFPRSGGLHTPRR